MALLRKYLLAFFISICMITFASISVAEEEITTESVLNAFDLTISTADEVVAALQNAEDADKIEGLYRKIKSTIKGAVVSDSKVAVPRSKANSKNSASRRAFRKGEMEKAIKLASEAAEYYKKARANVKYK